MLSIRLVGLALVSVALSSLAQLAFKYGMTRPEVQIAVASESWVSRLVAALSNPAVLGGFALYGLSAVLWLLVLSKLDVSVAYPFVALGFVVTLLCGAVLFGEQVTALRIAGTVLICAGVILVGRSA